MALGSNVIYLPSQRRETLGSDIGKGISAAVMYALMQKEKEKKDAQARLVLDGIRNAPDRAAALEVVTRSSGQFKDAQDYSIALRMVDEAHPASDSTPQPVTVYDANTGEQATNFVTTKQLKQNIGKPDWETTLFGPDKTTTKPDIQQFYQPGDTPGEFKAIGRLPVGKRPEGALTLPEIEQQRKAAEDLRKADADRRAENRDRRSEEQLRLQQERFALDQRRTEAMLGRIAASLGDKEGDHARRIVNDSTRLLATAMNARVFPDGSFGFDDENKSQLFYNRLQYLTTRIEADPSILKSNAAVTRLVTEVAQAVPGKRDAEPAAPALPTPSPGGKKDAKASEKKLAAEGKVGRDTLTPQDKAASIANAKAAVAQVNANKNLSVYQKAEKIKLIKERMRAAGITEDL